MFSLQMERCQIVKFEVPMSMPITTNVKCPRLQAAANKERRSRKYCMFDLCSNCKIIAICSAKSNISNLATIEGDFHRAAWFYEFVDSKSLALSFV